jgi:hypothetical protein
MLPNLGVYSVPTNQLSQPHFVMFVYALEKWDVGYLYQIQGLH